MSSAQQTDWVSMRKIAAIVQRTAGITLDDSHAEMIRCRLGPRIRQLGLDGYEAYADLLLTRGNLAERAWLLDAITTTLTHFMREPDHFRILKSRVVARLRAHGEERLRSLRMWSAACSSGEEPYSIAISVAEELGNVTGWDVKILGTDLNRRVLRHAKAGTYGEPQVAGLDPHQLATYFEPTFGKGERAYRISESLRRMVKFARLNLVEPWPMQRKFDAIFCRNVLIYFGQDVRANLARRFSTALRPGGLLFIGHSETLEDVTGHALKRVDSATYLKPPKGVSSRRTA